MKLAKHALMHRAGELLDAPLQAPPLELDRDELVRTHDRFCGGHLLGLHERATARLRRAPLLRVGVVLVVTGVYVRVVTYVQLYNFT